MGRRQFYEEELCSYNIDDCPYLHHLPDNDAWHLSSIRSERFDISYCLRCNNRLWEIKRTREGKYQATLKYSYFQPSGGSVFHIQFDDEDMPLCNRKLPRKLV